MTAPQNAAGTANNAPRIALVYASIHHDNTLQIARAMADELSAELLEVDQAQSTDMSVYDLVGLGSGIYFGRHHRSIRRLAESWEPAPRDVFLFSTAGLPFLWPLQHSALRRRVTRRGSRVVGEFCCRGWDTVGPLWLFGGLNRHHPTDRDLNRAREFARTLPGSLTAQKLANR